MPYLRAFSQSHLAVAPDNRGFGESAKPPHTADYDIQHLIADVVSLAAHFSAKPITLVGHDWGGIVAWHVAARFPQLVKRLVILNAPHPTLFRQTLLHNAAQRAASQYIMRLRDHHCEARIQALGLETFWMSIFATHLASHAISLAHKQQQLDTWRADGALTAMLNWYRASPYVVPTSEADVESQAEPHQQMTTNALPKIALPTLVIWGLQDPMLLPCQLEGLADYASPLTIKTLATAGHGLLHEMPLDIIRLIQDFIDDTSSNVNIK
ncbi:MAG: alpha/beta hydrolase [Gammaproteobacteria bacterium]|nr:alpha/beta hydrolase [Gammaproteobacteria bacterium]